MTFGNFAGYMTAFGLSVDALANLGTTGHNVALELLFASAFALVSGISHFYHRFIKTN
jgi:hypothetical protein